MNINQKSFDPKDFNKFNKFNKFNFFYLNLFQRKIHEGRVLCH